MSHWEYDDGGRSAAGYKGHTGDCVVRSFAIATERPYAEVYDLAFDIMRDLGSRARSPRKRKSYLSGPRGGVPMEAVKNLATRLGMTWTAVMGIGTGCTMRVTPDELPAGRIVIRASGHLTAAVDGVVRDTYDCTRGGTRCVYGYWRAKA